MKHIFLHSALLATTLLTSSCLTKPVEQQAQFSYFEYSGNDSIFSTPIDPTSSYLNPVLTGFQPDPSICRKGDDYFLVTSSFAYYPGVPIFHSKDLVNWEQIGHVLNRPSQLANNDSLPIRGGIYAPDIKYNPHNELFYLVTTHVGGGGNFFVTTDDPLKGEWSDPTFLPEVGGIDPGFLFDTDGKAYIVNNQEPAQAPEYEGHRAIWVQEFDWKKGVTVGNRTMIVDGGIDKATKPIWIEGPHLYHIDGKYYLMCAEGGTSINHTEVILTADNPMGPFTPCKINPILSQRELPANRANPVTCTGHADLVQTPQGDWHAVFLACRPYDGGHYNTGRETYLLPVTWKEGVPIILELGEAVPYTVQKEGLQPIANNTVAGNFSYRDEFDTPQLAMEWSYIRTPQGEWWNIEKGSLNLTPIERSIHDYSNPAYLGRRFQHHCFEAETEVHFQPTTEDEFAGLLCFQNEQYYTAIGITKRQGETCLVVERAAGEVKEVARKPWSSSSARLKVKAENERYTLLASANGGASWEVIAQTDGRNLSTETAGGFTGAFVGLYASGKHAVAK